jgi:hypothetical protein
VKSIRVAIGLAITAALVRLIPLHFLHPLNWDELEFFRATAWIAEGRVPFRDFWEHHTPLVWYLFAPFTLTGSTGTGAVIALRWAQVPVWIATFVMLNAWMRGLGIDRFARWAAMALALSSSLLMLPALEFRVEAVACAFFVAGLLLAQRERWFGAGVAFCLVGLANLRFGPLVVVVVLVMLATREGRWKWNPRAAWIFAGGLAMLTVFVAYFAANGALDDFYRQVWIDNQAEKFYARAPGRFIHRLLVPFGIRMLASDRLFELAAVDIGGVAVILLGLIGTVRSFVRGRTPDPLFALAVGSAANLLFIARMKFVYNYHFSIVVICAIPLVAMVMQTMRKQIVMALLVAAWSVNGFAAIFRGKELDLAYQDRVMQELHARTPPGETVWSGAAWALRREPAYRFWFLPELVAQMVLHTGAPRYTVDEVVQRPPAVVIFDHNTYLWMAVVQRDLGPYFVRHYIPAWRELWIPAMNARLAAGGRFEWIVPRDGHYRVHVSRELAAHPWFHAPIRAARYKEADAARLTFALPPAGAGAVRFDRDVTRLRRGERLTATNPTNEELAVIVIPTDERVLFRQPPPGVTLEGETTRITHVPQLGARIEP